MTTDERKKTFRYLLRSVFFDECDDIEDDRLIGFYFFLLDSLDIRAEMHVKHDNDDYFVIGSIIHVLSFFHKYDSGLLLFIVKNPENFHEFIASRTGLSLSFVQDAIERAMSDFQDIKQGYQFAA